jgi:alpha-amylase
MDVCLYFQIHQPHRLLEYSFFQIGKNHFYENDELNEKILNKIADNCYLPANKILLKLIKAHPGKFKVAFSISGITLEQFKIFRPDVLKSFQELAKTGSVEFLAETYYHSLSFLYNKEEFAFQVKKHGDLIAEYFGQKPKIFRNTELIYSNEVAQYAEGMGYTGILTEGVDRILKTVKPHQLFKPTGTSKIATLLRDHTLSDDISFRFSDKTLKDYPLTAKKYVAKIEKIKSETDAKTVNLFMDYETFGEHHHEETGIMKFLEKFPSELIENGIEFKTPSEIIKSLNAKEEYNVPDYISWADTERDLSAWLSNSMQYETLAKINEMRNEVLSTENEDLINTWRKLQTSDHFYYMCTKYWADGDVHKYFTPFHSPYDAYIFYMNVLSDFEITLKKAPKVKK